MRLVRVTDSDSLASQTEVMLAKAYEKKQNSLRCFFPTGRSAERLYSILTSKTLGTGNSLFWTDKLEPLQIDEFVGGNNLFYQTLSSQLLKPLHLELKTKRIDCNWSSQEFENHMRNILSTSIDLAILGLGPNGHIGFHEPSIQAGIEFLGGKVTLCEESFQRVKNAPGRQAFTFGAGAFLKAKQIILLATGVEKREIFSNFLRLDPTPSLPASLLKNHPDFTVITDLN
jgi:glucosamine-6-phosphate deaminase